QELVATTLSNLAELNQLLARMGKLLDDNPPPAPSSPPPTPSSPPATPQAQTPQKNDSPGAAAASSSSPLVIVRGTKATPPSTFLPNGVLATTGDYLLKIDSGGASEIARSTDLSDRHEVFLTKLHQSKVDSNEAHKGLAFGDENKPQEAGWALVVHANDDAALIKALSPLIEKRCLDQSLAVPALDVRDGETCGAWLARKVQNINAPMQSGVPVLLYNTGESVPRFLARHGTSVGPVNPEQGVPFYLLLAARPGAPDASDTTVIPFEFQYELDIFWGVGRLCFTDPKTGKHKLNAYSAYAEQVVAFEGLTQPPYGKHIAYFGTRHDFDLSTQRSADELVQPLFAGNRGKALAERFGFSQQLLLGAEATRSALDGLLRGTGKRPAMLFTATHGIGFPAGDERLPAQQGALVCQDWSGIGNITREHWFAAEDVSASTNVTGLIAVCFACYGAGCPQNDQFVFTPGTARPQIAPLPLVAQLPQQLLARGALAVLGHVDRAWTHSFSAPGVPAQTQGFESVLGRLMQGDRLGRATDQFNMLQGAVSTRLTEELEKTSFGKNVKTDGLAALWAARNDARNYALLGDPMVKLPF
ncbi:MAG: peptidase C1, partial [Chloroflexaceae bacterium]|nr:peptidase C1 [Chloroflexaceae bacterium]